MVLHAADRTGVRRYQRYGTAAKLSGHRKADTSISFYAALRGPELFQIGTLLTGNEDATSYRLGTVASLPNSFYAQDGQDWENIHGKDIRKREPTKQSCAAISEEHVGVPALADAIHEQIYSLVKNRPRPI